MLGRESHWEQFPNFVVSSSTFGKIPPALNKCLEGLVSCEEEEHFSETLEMTIADHSYQGQFLPLVDASSQDVGDIVVLADITNALSELQVCLIRLTVSCTVVGSILFGFFYFYVGGIENKLTQSYSKLHKSETKVRQQQKRLKLNPTNNKKPHLFHQLYQKTPYCIEYTFEHRVAGFPNFMVT